MKVQRIDHVGVVVNDLAAVKAFFLDFGFEVQREGELSGEWIDQVVGLTDVKAAYVGLRLPDGQANLELLKFHEPADEKGVQQVYANSLGIRHIAFAVDDIEAVVAKLKKKVLKSLMKSSTIKRAINGFVISVDQRGLFWNWRST